MLFPTKLRSLFTADQCLSIRVRPGGSFPGFPRGSSNFVTSTCRSVTMTGLFRRLLTSCLAITLGGFAIPRPVFGHYSLVPHCVEHPPDDIFNCSIMNPRANDPKGWKVCNYSTSPIVKVAHAYYTNSWRTQGWFYIDNGKCKKLTRTYLRDTRYLFAVGLDDNYRPTSAVWSGNTPFCVNMFDNFTYASDVSCRGDGVEIKKFMWISTPDITGHTTNLN